MQVTVSQPAGTVLLSLSTLGVGNPFWFSGDLYEKTENPESLKIMTGIHVLIDGTRLVSPAFVEVIAASLGGGAAPLVGGAV